MRILLKKGYGHKLSDDVAKCSKLTVVMDLRGNRESLGGK